MGEYVKFNSNTDDQLHTLMGAPVSFGIYCEKEKNGINSLNEIQTKCVWMFNPSVPILMNIKITVFGLFGDPTSSWCILKVLPSLFVIINVMTLNTFHPTHAVKWFNKSVDSSLFMDTIRNFWHETQRNAKRTSLNSTALLGGNCFDTQVSSLSWEDKLSKASVTYSCRLVSGRSECVCVCVRAVHVTYQTMPAGLLGLQ